MWHGRAWLTVTRDVACLVLGIAGVVHQAFLVEQPEISLLIFFAGLMAGPGMFATRQLEPSGTGGPSVPPP